MGHPPRHQRSAASPLSIRRATVAEGLGTIVWDASIANLTVAGLLFFTLRLDTPGKLATVWSIRLTSEQSFILESPRRPGVVFKPEATESLLYARGHLPSRQNFQGSSQLDRDLPLWQGDETPGLARKRDISSIGVEKDIAVAERRPVETVDVSRVSLRFLSPYSDFC